MSQRKVYQQVKRSGGVWISVPDDGCSKIRSVMERSMQQYLKAKPKAIYSDTIRKLADSWTKCIERQDVCT
jgi:hypothetical protein